MLRRKEKALFVWPPILQIHSQMIGELCTDRNQRTAFSVFGVYIVERQALCRTATT
jgi:hypothetical protein